MSSEESSIRRLVECARTAESLLVATDFDGVIAEITDVPEQVAAEPVSVAALSSLAREGVHVAVISGRTPNDLRERTRELRSIWRVAEHGAFIEPPPGFDPKRCAALGEWQGSVCALGSAALLDELLGDAVAFSERMQGIVIERKLTGIAIHFRHVSERDRPHVLVRLSRFIESARRRGLVVLHGRLVLEVRIDTATKATALEMIADVCGVGKSVIYAGDDATDEPALRFAETRGGVGVYIASSERPEPRLEFSVVLSGVAAWSRALTAIAAART